MLTILIFGMLAVAAWVTICEQQDKQFRRFAKPGDPIRFYIGEVKHIGKILAIDETGYTVETIENETKYVGFEGAWPVLRYKYQS